MDTLIPTFRREQKVTLHYHPYEMRCPHCNVVLCSDVPPFDVGAVVLRPSQHILCLCGDEIPHREGWWTVQYDYGGGIHQVAVPYTLLEALPEEAAVADALRDEVKG